MKKKGAIILAAGRGKRMKSKLAKVLHPLAGMPMLFYLIDLVERVEFQEVFVIVGHQAEQVINALSGRKVTPILQDPPLGTGHAVLQAKTALKDFNGPLLIFSGDTPLLRDETIRRLWALHQTENGAMTLLTTRISKPSGYGRVVRNEGGTINRIVEEKDATPAEREIQEVNTGVYLVEATFLFNALEQIRPDNRQKEYYLTDLIRIAAGEGKYPAGMEADPEEVIGINSRADLAAAEGIARRRINSDWMAEGVTLIDPARIQIDAAVTIGRDSVLHPGVTLEGKTEIGEGCIVYPSRIKDSRLGKGVMVKDHCVIEAAEIESGGIVGPFAHLRPGTLLRKGAKIGNFVEIKKSELGEGS
ncbi:MAG: bifunctional UDP-N-acetylglucosamine diphosphorylase/glucosamine-1-phosphate N-acetyltransferase GlmU, partial [Nitrospiria bacterium]